MAAMMAQGATPQAWARWRRHGRRRAKDEFWTTLTLVSLRTCTPFCLHRGVPRAWWTRRVLRELMCATFIDEDEEQMLGLLLLL